MNRTTPQFGGPTAAGGNPKSRFPEFTGVSPRVTSQTYSAHRGEFVSIVAQPTALNSQHGSLEAKCVVTDQPIEIMALPTGAEVAQVNEFICYVDPSNGSLSYFQHGTFNDEFDVGTYRKLIQLSGKFPAVF